MGLNLMIPVIVLAVKKKTGTWMIKEKREISNHFPLLGGISCWFHWFGWLRVPFGHCKATKDLGQKNMMAAD